MHVLRGFGLSVVFAAVGAALWAGVTYWSGWEFTLLGIVAGGLAGLGFGLGTGGRGSFGTGAIAAILAFGAFFAGKYAGMQLLPNDSTDQQTAELLNFSDEDAIDALANKTYDEYEAQGIPLGMKNDTSGWPEAVWHDANEQWNAMSKTEKEAYRSSLEENAAAQLSSLENTNPLVGLVAFLLNFSFFDLVCLLLAMMTAYKTAARNVHAEFYGTESDGATSQIAATSSGFVGLGPASNSENTSDEIESGQIGMALKHASAQHEQATPRKSAATPPTRPVPQAKPTPAPSAESRQRGKKAPVEAHIPSPNEFLKDRMVHNTAPTAPHNENAGIFSRLGKKEAADDGLPTFGGKKDKAA
ncbi:MAG TPA: hypothetical protein VG711_01220 [Phycisphaerales bacterium]|nr:hypothetical protein [Phycisphaerales bacterium]